jgi:hypothetical protein
MTTEPLAFPDLGVMVLRPDRLAVGDGVRVSITGESSGAVPVRGGFDTSLSDIFDRSRGGTGLFELATVRHGDLVAGVVAPGGEADGTAFSEAIAGSGDEVCGSGGNGSDG